MSPDVLSQRLRELEGADVVRRRKLAPPAASRVYELTERGRALEPVLLALGRWGSRAPFPPGDARLGVDSLMIALLTVFDPAAADGVSVTCELRFGEHRFGVGISNRRLELSRDGATEPDATIDADPDMLAEVLWQGRSLADAQRSGAVAVEGDRRAAARLLSVFAP